MALDDSLRSVFFRVGVWKIKLGATGVNLVKEKIAQYSYYGLLGLE